MKLISRFFPLLVIAVLIAVWWIAALVIGVGYILPTPQAAFEQLLHYLVQAEFYRALGGTLLRALIGFVCSGAIALALAVASALCRPLRRVCNPLMAVVRAVPTMSVIFLLILWFTAGRAPAVVALIVVCPTLYSAFLAAIDGVDPALIEACKAYRVSRRDLLVRLYLPNMAEGLFEGCASGISLNLKLVVAAEAIAQTADSIGKMMQYSNIWLETEKLFALTVAIMLCGIVLEWGIRLIGRRVTVWKTSS